MQIGLMTMSGTGVRANGWTAGRLAAATGFVAGRMAADFADVAGLPSDELLALRDDPGWSTDGQPPPADSQSGPEDVIAVLLGGRHEFPAGLEDGVEYASYLIADRLQDGIIDDLGRPWPELRDAAGRSVGTLEPRYEHGLAHWALRGDPFCAVGQLTRAVPAAGLSIA
jgi:hypothetical protein